MSDYFMRMIDQIGEMARALADKDEGSEEHIISERSSKEENLTTRLLASLEQKQYNQGENILFEYAEEDRSAYVLYAGKLFYTKLLELTEAELEAEGFSRKEVYQGLKDFTALFKDLEE